MRPALRLATVLLTLLPVGVGGCAKYNYVLREPPDVAGVVVNDEAFAEVEVDPLTYLWRVKENTLVVRVANRSGEAVRLLGDRSVAVDPDGESHPLRGQTIAPGSYAQLILPPPEPRVRGYGPRIGVGIGAGFPIAYRGGAGRYRFADPYFGTGLSGGYGAYRVIDEGNNYYWDWRGETVARFTFAYEYADGTGRGGDRFTHSFTVARVKVK